MTEAEWLACDAHRPMLEYLHTRASERKLRLFACACCRRIWHLLRDKRQRNAVRTSERYADGRATETELERTFWRAWEAGCKAPRTKKVTSEEDPRRWVWSVLATAGHDDIRMRNTLWFAAAAVFEALLGEEPFQPCDLLRDLFANPFRTVAIDPPWRAPDAVNLAQEIYDDRTFDRLPELADALEKAGCDNADILAHCRQPGEHVRGCWVVDGLLGKS